MIETLALVTEVAGDSVIVSGRAQSACERCARGEGCGGGLLGRLVRRSGGALRLARPQFQVDAGDLVVLGIPEQSLLTAMFEAYALPLLGMIAASVVASLLMPGVDALAVASGACGLVAGALAGRRLLAHGAVLTRPRLLRRATAREVAGCEEAP